MVNNILMDLDGIIAIRNLRLFKCDETGVIKDNKNLNQTPEGT